MIRSRIWLVLGMMVGLIHCSEPADEVLGVTTDGRFEIFLKADPNWVRSEASMPILVQVRRLDTTVKVGTSERIEFVVNNGTISPSNVIVSFDDGATDPAVRDSFTTWVTFKASRTTTEIQAEVYALFKESKTTFKTRIVPLVTSVN